MKKYLKILAFVLVLSAAMPARADIEAVSAALKAGVSNVQSELEKLQDLQRQIQDAGAMAKQQIANVEKGINQIKDATENPFEAVQTAVFEGMKNKVDGSGNEDAIVDDVKANYNRVYGAENAISIAKERKKAINALLGQNAATLYARALVLRQELMAEENPDDNLDSIQNALQASAKMMIQSSRRWNKILEMQAYINEFKSTTAVQGFTLDEEVEQ